MPARNFLSEDQVKRLQNELRKSELGYVRERVLILLLQISSSQIRRILKAKKYRYIWEKYTLEDKQDVAKREAFKKKISYTFRFSKRRSKVYPDMVLGRIRF